MLRAVCVLLSVWWWGVVILLSFSRITLAAPVVWTGPTISFSKLGTASPSLPANQDRLTSGVWLTRGGFGQGGIYNIALESGYNKITDASPLDTEWATNVIPENMEKTIAADNFADLEFTTWAEAYGGPGSALIGNITSTNAVVHLITDDIYLDLMFTSFNSTGLFSYERSTPALVPTPTGDYNDNGTVDAADYVVWRNTLTQTVPNGSGADGSGNGTIDAGDYGHWRARFGNAVPASASNIAPIGVPEPAAAILASVGFLLIAIRRWR